MSPATASVDYQQATKRHFDDGILLEHSQRIPNAGQLYGFGAECGLKALFVALGVPVEADGGFDKNSKLRVHIDKLSKPGWIANSPALSSGRNGAKYFGMVPSLGDFSDWSTDHRYCSIAAIPVSIAKWRQAANEIGQMLDQALLDRVLS